jgi:hypothetical protein
MSAKGKPKRTRGSWAGHSFYEEYQQCPRKFYIHRYLRIAPKFTAPPLLFGTAFHEAKSTFYKTKSRTRAVNKFISTLKQYAHLYEVPEVYHDHKDRGELMIGAWISDYGIEDIKKFDLIASEKTLDVELELLPGFFHTVKPDTIVRVKGGKAAYILESKSTMFSANITAQAVHWGDQATGQIWAVRKKYPKLELRGVIPDVTFWSKNSTNPAKIQNLRGSVITRSNQDLYEYELMMTVLIHEISQRIQAVEEGYNPVEVFPRATTWCMSFSSPCEYAYICRNQKLTAKGRAPHGFFRDQAPKKQNALKKIRET